MNTAVKEYLLELSRIALISALPVLIVSIESGVDYKTILILISVAVLKAIDKGLHESKIAEKGLTRF